MIDRVVMHGTDYYDALTDYLDCQRFWSEQTFGPGRRTIGITEHIKKELQEIRDKPEDLSEWVDVIILAMDGYWRHGGKSEDLIHDLIAKQKKNFGRTYLKPPEDQPSEHVRTVSTDKVESSNPPERRNYCRVVYEEPTQPRFAVHYQPPGSGVCILDRFHTEEEANDYIAGLDNKDFHQIIKEARK